MLESVRQNSRSAIVYILFGIIIVAFVISFGPGSPSGDSMPWSLSGRFAAHVYGNEVPEHDFHFAYLASGGGERSDRPEMASRSQRLKKLVMDKLIERELLYREAEHMGLLVSEDEAAHFVVYEGKMMVLGMSRPLDRYAFKSDVFDPQRFKMVLQSGYRVTEKQFMEIQRRELQADKVRQLLRLSVRAGLDEVKADFEDKGRQINLEYVRFAPYKFEAELAPSEADIENFARAHEDDLKKRYEERKALYTKQERSVRVRRILVEVKKDAPAEAVAAGQQKIEAALATLKAGTPFADVARTQSDDAGSRGKGGDLGWRKKGFTDFGADLETKVFAGKEGDLLGPERGDRGFEIIKIETFREGDISLGQARAELAEELYKTATAKDLAQKGAAEAAEKVKAGGKLAELYPKAEGASPLEAGKGRPNVEETGLFARRGSTLQGLGESESLAKDVWKRKAGELVGPVEVGGSFIVAVVKERKEPDLTDFEKRKDELLSDYARTKWAHYMSDFAHNACTTAQSAGKLRFNPDLVASEGPNPAAKNMPPGLEKLLGNRKYEPCREGNF
ncbi:MAG TPA: SurA N-terminal domain-containing protein [Pseudomonadota bacterium]|nr:SurA N-terminal domain-containing protein [Pseudomonadota bacterium]